MDKQYTIGLAALLLILGGLTALAVSRFRPLADPPKASLPANAGKDAANHTGSSQTPVAVPPTILRPDSAGQEGFVSPLSDPFNPRIGEREVQNPVIESPTAGSFPRRSFMPQMPPPGVDESRTSQRPDASVEERR